MIRVRRTRFRHFAYRHRRIRYPAWQGSRFVGQLRRHLLSGRRWLLWLLLVEELVLVLSLALAGRFSLDWVLLGFVYVFVGWVAQIFVLVLAQARKRVVVEQFTDSTGDAQKPDSRGLATLLVGELAEFRDLYSTVDERAIPTAVQKSRPLAATIKVEDVSDFLESPALIETKASVGPVQVPIGALFAFLGRFVRGPRLFGGVHVEEGSLVLAAQLAQQRDLKTWRVERSLPAAPANGRIEVPQDMIRELACRMFSDLALGSPGGWEATKTFAAALSSIRDCLRTPENRRIRLQEAEGLLIQALKEDEQLGYVFYNLGVVFTELSRLAEDEGRNAKSGEDKDGNRSDVEARTHWNAAEVAFRRQIELTPDRWEAYYALAQTYKGRRPTPQWDYVLKRCDRVASMKPGRTTTAKVLLLKSDANSSKYKDLLEKGETERADAELEIMIENRQMAVAEAWTALCQGLRSGLGDTALEAHLAASALKGLAAAIREEDRRKTERQHAGATDRPSGASAARPSKASTEALHLLGRAVELAPNDAAIRFALGKAATESDPQRAIGEIDEALRIDPTKPKYWRTLALLHAQNAADNHDAGEADHAEYCCKEALRLIDCYDAEPAAATATATATKVARVSDDEESVADTLDGVEDAYEKLGEGHTTEATHVAGMLDLARLCREEDPAKVELTKLEGSAAAEDPWEAGQALVALGRLDLRGRHYKAAEERFELALEKLDPYPEEIVRRHVRIDYAEALQNVKPPKYDDAFEELRRAIGDDPLHSAPREALADAYAKIHDYKQAERVLEDALRWDPDRPMLHRKRGRCRWELAQDWHNGRRRREALVRAVASFRRALQLSEHHTLDVQLVSHYWLARLHKELGQYERAIPYLRRATICKGARPLIRLLLGEAYIRARAYDAAEDELEFAAANALKTGKKDYGEYFEDTGWPPRRVEAYAHTLLALGYAERGVKPPKAQEAMDAAGAALKAARGSKPDRALDATEAAYKYVQGLFALAQQETAPNGLTTAIEAFRTSLGLSPQSETYVGIARACLYKTEDGSANTRRWIERGEDACRTAIDLDATDRFSDQAETLLAEFAEARQWLQARAAAAREEELQGASGRGGNGFKEATAKGVTNHVTQQSEEA
jgi:tetratricopeptide (TPR) repeat protein